MSAPVIVILGPPGSGKGTQSAILADKLGAMHLSSGEVLRSSGEPELLAHLATGKLATSESFRKAVGKALDNIPSERVIILDGVGRKKAEVEWLILRLESLDRPIKKVIHLNISQAESLRRNLPRQRLEDRPESQNERWGEYQRHMLQTMDYYAKKKLLVEVDGNGTVEEVASRVEDVIK